MNRKSYQKEYQKKNSKKLRAYKTLWQKKARDRERLLKIKELHKNYHAKIIELLMNIKVEGKRR